MLRIEKTTIKLVFRKIQSHCLIEICTDGLAIILHTLQHLISIIILTTADRFNNFNSCRF